MITRFTPHRDAVGELEAVVDDVPFVRAGHLQEGLVACGINALVGLFADYHPAFRRVDRSDGGLGAHVTDFVVRAPRVVFRPCEIIVSVTVKDVRRFTVMPVVVGLDDATIENVCTEINTENNVVVPANYNCPGQLVISGNVEAVKAACEKLKAAGAKRALLLPVGGAFHSPLMQPAKDELQAAIEATTFNTPKCAVYQNVDAQAHTDAEEIKANLIAQLTASVRWTQEVQNMIAAGATDFTECGPGKVLQGMIGKIAKGNDAVTAHGIQA